MASRKNILLANYLLKENFLLKIVNFRPSVLPVKDASCQTWQPEFDLQDPQDDRRKPTPVSHPLASTCCCVHHIYNK